MKTKIIALPTEDIKNCAVWRNKMHGQYGDYETYKSFTPNTGACQRLMAGCYDAFHLYMLAPDAEIHEWDIIMSNYTGRKTGYNKVIASTNTSLGLDLIGGGVCREFCESENRKK